MEKSPWNFAYQYILISEYTLYNNSSASCMVMSFDKSLKLKDVCISNNMLHVWQLQRVKYTCQLDQSEIYLLSVLKCTYMHESKHLHFEDDSINSITCSSEKVNYLVTIDRTAKAKRFYTDLAIEWNLLFSDIVSLKFLPICNVPVYPAL